MQFLESHDLEDDQPIYYIHITTLLSVCFLPTHCTLHIPLSLLYVFSIACYLMYAHVPYTLLF